METISTNTSDKNSTPTEEEMEYHDVEGQDSYASQPFTRSSVIPRHNHRGLGKLHVVTEEDADLKDSLTSGPQSIINNPRNSEFSNRDSLGTDTETSQSSTPMSNKFTDSSRTSNTSRQSKARVSETGSLDLFAYSTKDTNSDDRSKYMKFDSISSTNSDSSGLAITSPPLRSIFSMTGLRNASDKKTDDVQPVRKTSAFEYWKEISAHHEQIDMENSLLLKIYPTDEDEIDASTTVSQVSNEDDRSEDEEPSILNWSAYQRELKDRYNIIRAEFMMKEGFVEEIKKLSMDYLNSHLNIRNSIELLQQQLKTKESENLKNGDCYKTLLPDPYQALGDSTFNVKKLLERVYENPRIAVWALRSTPDTANNRALEYSLCNQFYMNLIENGKYEYDLLRFMAEVIKADINESKHFGRLYNDEGFSLRLFDTFYNRNECRKYSKILLKNPIIKIIRDGITLILDHQEVIKQLAKRNRPDPSKMMVKSAVVDSKNKPHLAQRATVDHSFLRSASLANSMQSEIELKKSQPKSKEDYLKMLNSYYQEKLKGQEVGKEGKIQKTVLYSDLLGSEEKKIIDGSKVLPIFTKRDRNGKRKLATQSSNSNMDNVDKKRELETKCIMKALEDVGLEGESHRVWSKNLIKLTSYVNPLLQSLFDNFYSMPVSIRILAKITTVLVQEKFPAMKKKDVHDVLARMIFTNWIIPMLLNPDVHEVVDELPKCRVTLTEVTKLFHRVIFQDTYPQSEELSVLNPYIKFFKTSIETYFDELINVNCKQVREMILSDNTITEPLRRINIRSFCLSVEEIRTLARSISAQESKINEIDGQAVRFAKKIVADEKEFPISSLKTAPEQTYVNFFDLKFPKSAITSYVDDFLKIQGYSKDLSESEKLVAKCKHNLKQILLAIEEIKDLSLTAGNDEITIEDILEFSKERFNTKENKLIKKKNNTSVHISSRFLLEDIKRLDPAYKINNFQKMLHEMVGELAESSGRIYTKAQTNKIQLLRGLDSLKRRNEQIRQLDNKKMRILQRALIRDYCSTLKMHLCLRAPINPNSEDKIQVQNEKDCLAGKLAFINELTNTTVMNFGTPRDPKKKTSSSVREPAKDNKELPSEFHEHCYSLNQFLDHYASIPAVREAVTNCSTEFNDQNGVSETYSRFIHMLFDIAAPQMQKLKEEDKKLAQEEIEKYVGKKLYHKIFPAHDRADEAFWMRCKTLEWINFQHLEIPESNRCEELWNYVASKFAEIDYKLTPINKSNTVLEAFNMISYVVNIATMKSDFGADELTPIALYIMLRWCPKRIYSNLNFMSRFRSDYKILQQEQAGYYTENLRGAVRFLDELTHREVGLDVLEFEKLMHEKELKYEIYFLRSRPRSEKEMPTLDFSAIRAKRKAKAERESIIEKYKIKEEA